MRTGHLKNSYFKRDEMKQRISFTNICRFATWRVERIFQAIRQRSRDLANMKRRYFTPLLLPIDALIVLKKISVILWQRVSHFLFLDTNRQYKSYEKKSWFYLCCHQKPCKPIWWIISSSCDLCVWLLKNPLSWKIDLCLVANSIWP